MPHPLYLSHVLCVRVCGRQSDSRFTYRPAGAAAGLCPYQHHWTLTVNPSDRNSTGSLVGTSLDAGVGDGVWVVVGTGEVVAVAVVVDDGARLVRQDVGAVVEDTDGVGCRGDGHPCRRIAGGILGHLQQQRHTRAQ